MIHFTCKLKVTFHKNCIECHQFVQCKIFLYINLQKSKLLRRNWKICLALQIVWSSLSVKSELYHSSNATSFLCWLVEIPLAVLAKSRSTLNWRSEYWDTFGCATRWISEQNSSEISDENPSENSEKCSRKTHVVIEREFVFAFLREFKMNQLKIWPIRVSTAYSSFNFSVNLANLCSFSPRKNFRENILQCECKNGLCRALFASANHVV